MSLSIRLLAIATLSVGVGVVSIVAHAEEAAPTTQRAPRGPGGGPRGPGGGMQPQSLEGTMKAIARAYKGIGRQLDDAQQDAATLKLISDLQAATAASKGILPPQLEGKTDDASVKAAGEYRKQMLESLKLEITMEDALVAGDRQAAKDAYGKLEAAMKEGHKDFRVKDH